MDTTTLFIIGMIVIVLGGIFRYAMTKADKNTINRLQDENNRLKGNFPDNYRDDHDKNARYDSKGRRI